MTSISDQELAQTETLLRQRLASLPTMRRLPFTSRAKCRCCRGPSADGSRSPRRRDHGDRSLDRCRRLHHVLLPRRQQRRWCGYPEEAVTAFVVGDRARRRAGHDRRDAAGRGRRLAAAVESGHGRMSKRVGLLADDFDTVECGDRSNGRRSRARTWPISSKETWRLVTATSGTISGSFHAEAFSFGDKLRELVGETERCVDTAAGPRQFGAHLWLLMTVQRDGRWYVSLENTAGRIRPAVNRVGGLPDPVSPHAGRIRLARKLQQRASSSDLLTLDMQAALDTFAPGEDAMAWLAPAWIADVQAAVEQGRIEGWTVGISGLTYETIGSGDRVTLEPVTFKVEGTAPQYETTAVNPNVPTIIAAVDGTGFALVPPGEMPSTIDGLNFTDSFPVVDDANFTTANSDGTINQLVFPSEQTAGPQPFSFERADGCTTIISAAGAGSPFGGFSAFGMSPVATKVDGGYRICGSNEFMGGFGVLGLLVLSGGGLTDLPAISVVQTDGKWYVSPLGTLLASVSTGLHDDEADSSLFDSPLAPFLYGGFSRTMLESFVVDQPVDSVGEACLPALTVENGTVTGVVADPPLDAVRACTSFGFSSSSSGSEVVKAPLPVTVETTP